MSEHTAPAEPNVEYPKGVRGCRGHWHVIDLRSEEDLFGPGDRRTGHNAPFPSAIAVFRPQSPTPESPANG